MAMCVICGTSYVLVLHYFLVGFTINACLSFRDNQNSCQTSNKYFGLVKSDVNLLIIGSFHIKSINFQ